MTSTSTQTCTSIGHKSSPVCQLPSLACTQSVLTLKSRALKYSQHTFILTCKAAQTERRPVALISLLYRGRKSWHLEVSAVTLRKNPPSLQVTLLCCLSANSDYICRARVKPPSSFISILVFEEAESVLCKRTCQGSDVALTVWPAWLEIIHLLRGQLPLRFSSDPIC